MNFPSFSKLIENNNINKIIRGQSNYLIIVSCLFVISLFTFFSCTLLQYCKIFLAPAKVCCWCCDLLQCLRAGGHLPYACYILIEDVHIFF